MELVSLKLSDINVLMNDLSITELLPELDALELSPALYEARILHLVDDEMLLLVLHDAMHEGNSHVLFLGKEYFH